MSKKILFIVGSLRKGSFNHQLAKEAESLLATQAQVTYLDYTQVPVFSQDLETPTLPVLEQVRQEVLNADAIWIFSPVYNFSIPGPLKNLLDWLSRALDLSETRGPSALQDKLVTVSSVANAGHDNLFAQYRDLLPFIRTQVVEPFTATTVNLSAWETGQLELSPETKKELQTQAKTLLETIN
ncbi:NADPH-dependent FMN reductase [Streptococcus sp. sy004]|uniref:NADPH-dependent FMN reductase n=1 Tax=Streptococcus sp. sy004 TaxID=2600149 RepID=UPI0011B52BC2|nr:NADPH-dependent FMN reductase [Streptococcus sp. sy004]TWT09774.1 NAD(P)H-dependent oxidoreductase [Streptococcus sp. sy004]